MATDSGASNGLNSEEGQEQTPFEKQRDLLIGQITQVDLCKSGMVTGQSMEQIITNMNLLNRSIEGIIAVYQLFCVADYQVGKEFESVSTLWRSFHEVLAKEDTRMMTESGEERLE